MTNYFKYPTTNSEILEMKRELKFSQSRINRIAKLVKFNLEFYEIVKNDQNNFFSENVGKTRSYSKSILNTIEELIDSTIDLQFRCMELGLQIQRERQKIYNNLYK